ncbi:DUF2790 domain-containing protein [Pseudomonas sp. Q2-TVG4-2]|uniref:DUF2790 domain-containing protein n=1 Tax=Pseudomonas sp. Q2-TVG4-2 TaxID=1685699 RepID=UPI0015E67096|nr:DUF2790 domain-containing protein [Pseudomonas sp. Q2-TVG4-2]
MNRKTATLVSASIGLLLSFSALAERTPTPYTYGTKLDIVKVVSIRTEDSPVCKPVDYIMKYIDSMGKTQALKYKAHSSACSKRR